MSFVLSHRGRGSRPAGGPATNDPHDNTLQAMERALSLGADGSETDIRQTRDGVLVACHPSRIDVHRVESLTYKQLCDLTGKKVPTLAQVLKLHRKHSAVLAIQIKAHECPRKDRPLLVQKVMQEVQGCGRIVQWWRRRTGASSRVLFLSYQADVLALVKEIDPDAKTGLFGQPRGIAKAVSVNADYLVVHPSHVGTRRRAARKGLGVIASGLNREALVRRRGADAPAYVMTDRPLLAKVALDELVQGQLVNGRQGRKCRLVVAASLAGAVGAVAAVAWWGNRADLVVDLGRRLRCLVPAPRRPGGEN